MGHYCSSCDSDPYMELQICKACLHTYHIAEIQRAIDVKIEQLENSLDLIELAKQQKDAPEEFEQTFNKHFKDLLA